MPYIPTIPVFNIAGKFWVPGNSPSMGGPDYLADVQLYIPPRQMFDVDSLQPPKNMVMVVQIRTKVVMTLLQVAPYVTGIWGWGKPDGVPWNYRVIAWDWEHESFPNQYLRFDCIQCDDTGTTPDANR